MLGLLSLFGRIFLSAIFLAGAVHLGMDLHAAEQNLEKAEFPGNDYLIMKQPALYYVAVAGIAVLIIGSFLLIVGAWGRLGAIMLAAFLVMIMIYIPNFWANLLHTSQDPAIEGHHGMQFIANLSLLGAMIFVIANGAGRGSVDLAKKSRRIGL